LSKRDVLVRVVARFGVIVALLLGAMTGFMLMMSFVTWSLDFLYFFFSVRVFSLFLRCCVVVALMISILVEALEDE